MAEELNSIEGKINELENELKNTGLWEQTVPCPLFMNDNDNCPTRPDFIQWLRLVFIPNHLLQTKMVPDRGKKLLVPHAIKYFGREVHRGKLLQILIELDSLL